MPTFLKNFFRNKFSLIFFAVFFVVGGGFFTLSSVQATNHISSRSTCEAEAGRCESACQSGRTSIGTCGSSLQCCKLATAPTATPTVPCSGRCRGICDTITEISDTTGSCPLGGGVQCCITRGASTSAAAAAASAVGGVCSGGTCRSGSCSSGETPNGSCTTISGGTCCMPGGVTTSNSTPITFTNPLQYDTVEGVLDSILDTLRGIIVILSLVFIVIGAILYITSAGNDKQMTMAKGAITAAMIGLAIGLAAPSFLKEIGTVLGWDASVNQDALVGAKTLSQIARNVLDFLLSIVGVLAIIMLVVGGIMYLTAAGNEDQLDSGKKIVKYSIIGIAVALASLVIVSQIATFFG